jgi:hypothetical protein
LLGVGFDMHKRLSLDLGGGVIGYANARDQFFLPIFYQIGLSGRFGGGG